MPEVLTSNQQDTGRKQFGPRKGRFVPGDPRINRSGRPKSFDQFRELAQAIAQHKGKAKEILERWADSPEPQLQRAFIEYAFGKVPDKLETTGLENRPVLILHYAHDRPDAQSEQPSRN